LIRTRFIVVIAAFLMVGLSQGASAKTGRSLHSDVVRAGFTGSMKMMSEIFMAKRPADTPLLEWAKAATERARIERISRQGNHQPVSVMTEEETMFSRDRD
jgi:hypothetical protein